MLRSSLAFSVILTLVLLPSLHPSAVTAGRPAPNINSDQAATELKQGQGLLRQYQADVAFNHLQAALRLYTESGDRAGVAASQDALGDVYAQSGQYETSLGFYRKAGESFRQLGDTGNANAVFVKMGERYLLLGDLEKARAAFAAMVITPPDKTLKIDPAAFAAGGQQSGGKKDKGLVASPFLSCFKPGANDPGLNDPKNPPNQGRAPNTPNGVGRMDLRVTDEDGNPLNGVRAQIQSKRPGGQYCEAWNSTDDFGRAVIPPLHIADKIKLVLQARDLPKQTLQLSAQDLAKPVQVVLSKAGAKLANQAASRVSNPCLDFYRVLAAYARSELGTANADFLAGRLPEARKRYEELLAELGLPGLENFKEGVRLRTAALTTLGDIAAREKRYDDAVKMYTDAIENARKEYRLELLWAAQRGLGRLYWQQYLSDPNGANAGRLRSDAASNYIAAVKTIDTLRAGSLRADEARTSFIASTKDVFDEAAAVLTEAALVAAGPNASTEAGTQLVALDGGALSLANTAFSTVEAGRARSLLDLLGEARGGITEGLPADLLRRRNEIVARQQEIASFLMGVNLPENTPETSCIELEKELERLNAEYDGVENQIRTRSPRYDSLAGAKPLTLGEVQQKVVDANTALLLYNLGADASYLWVVSQNSVAVTRLPARQVIEEQVANLRARLIPDKLRRSIVGVDIPDDTRGLTLDDVVEQKTAGAQQADAVAAYARASHALYNTVLKRAAQSAGGKRLLVVADGLLNFVPFEALVTAPAPAAADYASLAYLVKTNEIAYAPSASVIGSVRQQAGQRARGQGGSMLIIADPVFNSSDARVKATIKEASASVGGEGTRGLTLDGALEDVAAASAGPAPAATDKLRIARLVNTRAEAGRIAQLANSAKVTPDVWLDLDASETNVFTRDMTRYRALHFATHGLLNTRQPQLTGLVLTLVGEQKGDGFLRVNEVFNFRLGSPLVMLSACETGLGREKRGEGVIGLTRAFMYAGAPTVGVSLWSVADRSTAQLMGDFYEGYFGGGAKPGEAMRKAQLKMIEAARYSAPYYWAPFILVGDWT